MENNIIHIPKLDCTTYTEITDVYCKLLDIKNKIEHKHQENVDSGKYMDKLIDEYKNEKNKTEFIANKSKEQWKSLLFKYYKMTLSKRRNGIDYKNVYYIFPYEITDNCEPIIWMLMINTDNPYIGGVEDTSYHIEDYFDYDTYLEEITKEDFYNMAHKTCDTTINRRLSKLETKPYKTFSHDELD